MGQSLVLSDYTFPYAMDLTGRKRCVLCNDTSPNARVNTTLVLKSWQSDSEDLPVQ